MEAEKRHEGLADEPPLQQFLTYRLSKVQAKLNAQAVAILKEHAGLTLAQWRVLALVGGAGQTRLSDLVKIAALDKGQVSRNVKAMVEDGLVRSKQDDLDQRVQHLSLTAKGRALFEMTLPRMRARQRKLRAQFNMAELEVLYRALDKLEIAAEDRSGVSK